MLERATCLRLLCGKYVRIEEELVLPTSNPQLEEPQSLKLVRCDDYLRYREYPRALDMTTSLNMTQYLHRVDHLHYDKHVHP